MKLGMWVGIGPDHIVLDGDPDPPLKGEQPPIFGPCLSWPNGQDSRSGLEDNKTENKLLYVKPG